MRWLDEYGEKVIIDRLAKGDKVIYVTTRDVDTGRGTYFPRYGTFERATSYHIKLVEHEDKMLRREVLDIVLNNQKP